MLKEQKTLQEKIEEADMVEFEYKCSVCDGRIIGDSLKGGDVSVIIHKRHGEEFGRVTGHYNKLGGVIEEDVFSDGTFSSANPGHPNSNDEICLRRNYLSRLFTNQMIKNGNAKENGKPEDLRGINEIFEQDGHDIKFKEMVAKFKDVEVKSGIVACHKSCYDNLSETKQNNLPISDVFKKS